jgi:hypothetical protein
LTNYSVNAGIGQIIRQRQIVLEKSPLFKKGTKELIVMIKPDRETSLNNLVKLLDEMMINGVSRYAFMDIQEEEKQLLKGRKLIE